ncbi:3516_t:CDS:2, partial [Entrophospora sp. SA101]
MSSKSFLNVFVNDAMIVNWVVEQAATWVCLDVRSFSCKTATENPNKDSCANKGEGKPFENTTEDLENLMKIVTDIFGDKNILNKILEMQSKEQKNGAKKSANFAEIKRNINDKENVTIVTDHK